MQIEHRTLEVTDLEVREDAGEHHILAMVAPWNATYDTGDFVERFGKSVFDKSIKERGRNIPLMHGHDRENMPIGRSASWEKDQRGLIADFQVAPTDRAREALTLAKDGYVTGFSVGFVPIRNEETKHDGRRYLTRIEAKLDHVALLTAPTAPAYGDAQLIAARAFDPDDEQHAPRLAKWRHLLQSPHIETRGALPIHTTAAVRRPWDGARSERNADSPSTEAYYRRIFAWLDPDADPTRKSSYGFPHHEVSNDGTPGAAVLDALAAGVAALNGARGGSNIRGEQRRRIWAHLAHHYEALDMEAPPLR